MGHSVSFPEMTTSGQTMDAYIQSRNAGIFADLQTTRDSFDKAILEAFSADQASKNQVKALREVFDWRQSDENNLDVISKMINQVASTALEGIAGEGLLPVPVMIGIATSAITDIMGLFTTKTSASYSSGIREVPLSPGLRMFATSVSIELEDKQIFNDGKMVVSWILYKIIFNNDLYKSEIKTDILDDISKNLHEDLATIDTANIKVNQLEVSILDMDPDSQEAKTARKKVDADTKVLASMTAMVNDLETQIDGVKTVLMR